MPLLAASIGGLWAAHASHLRRMNLQTVRGTARRKNAPRFNTDTQARHRRKPTISGPLLQLESGWGQLFGARIHLLFVWSGRPCVIAVRLLYS